MSSLWWLRAAQWRRRKGERRGERGEGSGRDRTGLQGREGSGRGKGEGRVREFGEKGEERLIKGRGEWRRGGGARTEGDRAGKYGMG